MIWSKSDSELLDYSMFTVHTLALTSPQILIRTVIPVNPPVIWTCRCTHEHTHKAKCTLIHATQQTMSLSDCSWYDSDKTSKKYYVGFKIETGIIGLNAHGSLRPKSLLLLLVFKIVDLNKSVTLSMKLLCWLKNLIGLLWSRDRTWRLWGGLF